RERRDGAHAWLYFTRRIAARGRQHAPLSRAGGAGTLSECAGGARRAAELRRNAASKRWLAAAHAAKYYRSARCSRTNRADSRTDVGCDRAEDISIATATRT